MPIQSTQAQRAMLQNAIADLNSKIQAYSQLYNSKNFQGSITAIGIEVNTGNGFSLSIEVDSDDDELRQYFNMKGATLINRKMLLQIELAALNKVDELKHDKQSQSAAT